MSNMTPREIVHALDQHIVGQSEAKRAVAIALRNRWRRQQLDPELRGEVTPKNILMIGPTGVGKTEIARRLAKLANAPFIKVEATKFTEVGFHGRDVDQIIRDLVEVSVNMTKKRCVGVKVVGVLVLIGPLWPSHQHDTNTNSIHFKIANNRRSEAIKAEAQKAVEEKILLIMTGTYSRDDAKETFRDLLRKGSLDDRLVDVEVPAERCVVFFQFFIQYT